MARPKSDKKKARPIVGMHATVREQLAFLVTKTPADSMTEVVRESLALLEFVIRETEKGNEFCIMDREGVVRQKVVLL